MLLVRRPAKGRLGGLWTFPAAVLASGEAVARGAVRAAREVVGLDVRAGAPIAVVRHTFTHVRATYHALDCRPVSGEAAALGCEEWAWAGPDQLERYAMPVAQKRIAALALARG
jgi:adenine-specific DNA glycosylase